jgi:hypothetical protein
VWPLFVDLRVVVKSWFWCFLGPCGVDGKCKLAVKDRYVQGSQRLIKFIYLLVRKQVCVFKILIVYCSVLSVELFAYFLYPIVPPLSLL